MLFRSTRGFKEHDFYQVGKIIARALKNPQNQEMLGQLQQEVLKLVEGRKLHGR